MCVHRPPLAPCPVLPPLTNPFLSNQPPSDIYTGDYCMVHIITKDGVRQDKIPLKFD